MPLLTKFQNDIQIVETAILNHFFSKMNVEDKVDAYVPVVAADKSYVIRGEEFSGKIERSVESGEDKLGVSAKEGVLS